MTLRTRLLLIILLSTVGSVLVTAAILASVAWSAMVGQARDDAASLAGLLGRVAAVAEEMPVRVASLIERERLGMAYALSHLVAAGRGDAGALDRRLAEIAAKSPIEEIRVVDRTGRTVGSSVDTAELPAADDRTLRESGTFAPLLADETLLLAPPGASFESEGRGVAYVGAGTLEGPGAVLVGYGTGLDEAVRDQVGLGRILRSLLAGQGADALWVFDDRGTALVSTSRREPGQGEPPAAEETTMVRSVLAAGTIQSELQRAFLSVAAPVLDADGIPAGAVLIRLPTTRLVSTLQTYLLWVAGISAGLIGLGVVTAQLTARRIAGPISLVTDAAAAIEQRRFEPGCLAAVERRQDEIGRLARVVDVMAVDLLGNERRLDELVRQRTHELEVKNGELLATHAQIEAELVIARDLQGAILPREFGASPDYACAATMLPATQLAGDFYDFIRLDEHRIALLVADVSGKGVPAAFFMAISRTVLQQAARGDTGPAACLAATNDALCDTNPLDLFVTLFYAVLDLRTGALAWANAGHNPPLVLRAARGIERLPSLGSPPLGVFKGLAFAERRTVLQPGDTLVMFTDGVTEAMDGMGELFGDDRLLHCLERADDAEPRLVIARVTTAVRDFAGAAPLADDLTCLVLRFLREQPAPLELAA